MDEDQEVLSADEAIAELILTTSYRIDHFYRYSIFQGGLTKDQFTFLFECHQEKILKEYQFKAALNGVDIRDQTGKKSKNKEVQLESQGIPLFGDPEEYADLPEEKRENLTNKMMGKHKAWAGDALNKKGSV